MMADVTVRAASNGSVDKAAAFLRRGPQSGLGARAPIYHDPQQPESYANMDRDRLLYTQSEGHDAYRHKYPLPRPPANNLRMRGNDDDDEEAQLSADRPNNSTPFSQRNRSWMKTLVLALGSSAINIRAAASKPTLRAVTIHGSLLALFWVVSGNILYSGPDEIFCPDLWFLNLWTALSCFEFVFIIFVGLEFCRHAIRGRRGMNSQFLLPTLVRSLALLIFALGAMRTKLADPEMTSFKSY